MYSDRRTHIGSAFDNCVTLTFDHCLRVNACSDYYKKLHIILPKKSMEINGKVLSNFQTIFYRSRIKNSIEINRKVL